MKHQVNLLLAMMLSAVLFSCGNPSKEDPKEIAEEQNEEKTEGQGTDMEDDMEFAVEAANASMLEVQLGKLATTNAASPQVKKFAETMVAEHGKANDELKTLAQQKNISLPAALGEDKQDKYQDLAEKKGEEFDKEYMDLMVNDHEKTIDLFEDQAKNGKDPEIRAWAEAKLTALRQHHEMARAARENVDERN